MKEIIIDGVSYILTPKITYKLNDWVYYINTGIPWSSLRKTKLIGYNYLFLMNEVDLHRNRR